MNTRFPARVAKGLALLAVRDRRRRLRQQPLSQGRGGDQHPVLHLRRTLAALPRPDRVVLEPGIGLHLPDLRAALRLRLPRAALQARRRRRRRRSPSPTTSTRTASALPDDAPAEQIAESVYDVPIKRGILYAPHPAFAKDDKGQYLYHHLTQGRARRQALALGLRGAGHARAGRRRLRLRHQAPRDDAHRGTGLRASSPST